MAFSKAWKDAKPVKADELNKKPKQRKQEEKKEERKDLSKPTFFDREERK